MRLLQREAPGQDPAGERDLLAAEATRLALSVPALGEEADDDRHRLEPWHVDEPVDDMGRRGPAEAPAGAGQLDRVEPYGGDLAGAGRHVELRERRWLEAERGAYLRGERGG